MIKNLLVNILFLVALNVLGQNVAEVDSSLVNQVPIVQDSVEVAPDTIRKSALEAPITYQAKDSIVSDFENHKVYLYKDAVVNYQNIELKADFIELNHATKEVYAEGLPDSSGTIVGTPVFKDGNEEFESKTLRYNFETQKGIITEVKTSQGDGYVHSERTKKISEDKFILQKGKYTTCDADHPHFYLRMTKAVVVSNKKIVTGPAYMVLEDFPLYFPILPFGYFPNSPTYSSGVIIPSYGEEQNRGFFLRDGGYYWAASEYFDLSVRGDIYSKGSWASKLQSSYRVRYKFSGSLNFSYNLNKYSEEPLPDARTTKGFSFTWTHTQDAKANPNKSFSANLNLSTSSYDRENSLSVQNYLQTQKSSSVSYVRKFENSPFKLSLNLSHSQNSRDSTLTLSIPQLTINMTKIFPFRSKNRKGPAKWYEQISIAYTGNIKNSITAREDEILQKSLVKDWKNGWKHTIPITLPSFNLFKYFNFSPGFNFSNRTYLRSVKKTYVPDYINPSKGYVLTEYEDGFYNNYEYSFGLDASTNIYGMYQMKNPNWKVKAIRHKITPSASFNYRPGFEQFWDYYTDASGIKYYSMFDGSVYSFTSRGPTQGISLNLKNNIEAKILDTKDTTSIKQNYKKVKLLDFNFSSSYNFIADSMKLTPIRMSGRTTIGGVNLNFGGLLNPYMVNDDGNTYDEYTWNHLSGIAKIGRLTNANMSFGMNFSSEKGKEKMAENQELIEEQNILPGNYPEYVDFSIPWNFRFDYSFNYSKRTPSEKATINQSLSLSGSLSLTENWQMSMNTNFDVQAMKFSFTTFNVSRTLHCWSMSFNFVPFGARKSYSFNLSARSSLLRDLKLTKQRSWFDN